MFIPYSDNKRYYGLVSIDIHSHTENHENVYEGLENAFDICKVIHIILQQKMG